MTEDKARKDQGGFFEDDSDDEYLSEKTVVDNEVLGKLNPEADTPEVGADVLEEVPVAAAPVYQPPQAETPPPKPALAAIPAPAPAPLPPKRDKLEEVAAILQKAEARDEEKTIILPDQEIQGMPTASGGKLLVVDGPDTGKAYIIAFNEIFVGRSVDNDFVVSDGAMSRKHFRIRRRFDEFIIADLGSGNGTRLNDKKIEEEVLHHGDIVFAGRSKLRFIDMQEEAKEAVEAPVSAPVAPPAPPAPPVAEIKPAPAPQPVVKPVEPPKPAPAPVAAAPKPAPAPKAPEPPKPAPAPQQKPKASPAPAPKPAPAKAPTMTAQKAEKPAEKKSSSTPLIIGVVLVVVALVAIVVVSQQKKAAPTPPAAVATAPAPTVDPKQAEAAKLLEEANGYMQNKFFAKAIETYDKVLILSPDHAEATAGKDKAKREDGNRAALEEGKKLIAEKQADKGIERLKAVDPQSGFAADAKAAIQQAYEAKFAGDLAKARKLLEGKKYDAVASVCDKLLAKTPDLEAASKLKAEAQGAVQAAEAAKNQAKADAEARVAAEKAAKEEAKAKAEEERKRKEDEKRAAADQARARSEEEKRAKAEDERKQKEAERRSAEAAEAKKRNVTGMGDLEKALGLYRSGKREDAIIDLMDISKGRGNTGAIEKAKKLVADMKSFNENYDQALRACNAKDAIKAIPLLKEAMRLDAAITANSSFANELRNKMADMFAVIGNQELQKEQYENASKAFSKAMQFAPAHAASKQGMAAVADAAKRLYYEGFSAKDRSPEIAKRKWQTLMKIVPSTNEWYKKAAAELEELE